jgi:ribonuclease P protein component
MLGKIHRFHGLRSLSYTYKRGQVVRGALLSLKYVQNNRQSTYRVAVVVSRKVHKSAVVRNRIRRRIYEAVRLHADQLAGPYDLIFTVFSPQLAEMPAPELKDLVHTQLKRANLLSKSKP